VEGGRATVGRGPQRRVRTISGRLQRPPGALRRSEWPLVSDWPGLRVNVEPEPPGRVRYVRSNGQLGHRLSDDLIAAPRPAESGRERGQARDFLERLLGPDHL